MYLELIRKIRDDTYVNDLMTGEESLQEVEKIKPDSIELFEKGWGGGGGGGGGLKITKVTPMNQI